MKTFRRRLAPLPALVLFALLGCSQTGGPDTGAVTSAASHDHLGSPSDVTSALASGCPLEPTDHVWHPARVHRDADGQAHFFDVWNAATGGYEPKILIGYDNVVFATAEDPIQSPNAESDSFDRIFDGLAASHANFVRLWLRPSDGRYAYQYDSATRKVDLTQCRPEFFHRLDRILEVAEGHGVVVEVMLWDSSTQWGEGDDGINLPGDWRGCQSAIGCVCPNVHNPNNHENGPCPEPLDDNTCPLLALVRCDKITDTAWFDTSGSWYGVQREYASNVLWALRRHDNVSIEVMNEAAQNDTATAWRKEFHGWLRAQAPDILLQSQTDGRWNNIHDENMRSWGASADGFGKIDMISSHAEWTFTAAANAYAHSNGAVLPGCNEAAGVLKPLLRDQLAAARSFMWGLVLGGGAAYVEDIPESLGRVVTNELHRFFYPPQEPPPFWQMVPKRNRIKDDDGTHFVLAKKDDSQILAFSTSAAAFEFLNMTGPYQYRWFTANGEFSYWGGWQHDTSWYFAPPGPNMGLQVLFDPDAGPTCQEMGRGWYAPDALGACEEACPGDDTCVRKQVCGRNGERCQPNPPGYCWHCPWFPTCGDGICADARGENCYSCPTDCPTCVGRTCGEMGLGWWYPDQEAQCSEVCEVGCQVKLDCGGVHCLAPHLGVQACLNCPYMNRCGDGSCQPRSGENCETCREDCGDCPEQTNSCGSQGFYEGWDYDTCVQDCGDCTRKQDCGGLPCDGGYCWRCGG